jgi:hypothetical protein
MELINRIRVNSKTRNINDAIDDAVNSCIEDDVMADVLLKMKAEVKDMCLTEYNEKLFIDSTRNEGRNEAKEEIAANMIAEGFAMEEITSITGTSIAFVEEVVSKLKTE